MCGSPRPRGEQIAKPAKRGEARLAGVCVSVKKGDTMKRTLEWLLVSFVVSVGDPTLGATQQASPDRQYTHPSYGWSVSYPSNWGIDSLDPTFVKITNPATLPYGLVGVISVAGVTVRSLDEFAERWMSNEAGMAGFRIVSRRPTVLSDGTRALEVVNVLGVRVVGKSHKLIVLDGDRGFAINAESYLDSFPAVEPFFDRILKSFTLRSSRGSGPGAPRVEPQAHGQPLPSHAIILGVPFISWNEAAKLDYHDKNVLNPSVPAAEAMISEYWGQDLRGLAKGTEAPEGWTSAGGEGASLDSLRSYVARGIPIIVKLAMTPVAHFVEPNVAALATLVGSGVGAAGSNLTQQQFEQGQQLVAQYAGIWSGVLGKMVAPDTLRRWGDALGTKVWQESVLLSSRVVVGYDDDRKVVIVHDPSFGPAWEIGYDDFETMWALFDHFYVVMYPPDYAKLVGAHASARPYAPRTASQRAAESFVFGYALASVGRLGDAKARLEAGLGAPDVPQGYRHLFLLELARVAEARGDTAAAISGYEESGKLIPQHHRPWIFESRLNAGKAAELRRKADKLCADRKAQEAVVRALPHDFTMFGCGGLLPLGTP